MKSKVSRTDSIKIFLREYYLGQGIYYSILRLIGGPLTIAMGVAFYLDARSKALVGYSGFMILFGVYYIFRPFISILMQKTWFVQFDAHYQVTTDKIIIQSGQSFTELSYKDIECVSNKGIYYVLRLKSKQRLYLPVKVLDKDGIELLDNMST